MTSDRGSWQRSERHTLPSRREQPDEYDSQSRYSRRDDAVERGQERVWDDARGGVAEDEDSAGSAGRNGARRVSKSEREASSAGVWTAALFVGLTALASVLWVVAAGLVLRIGNPPGLYEQLSLGLSVGIGYLGILGSLRAAWLLALAPRVKEYQRGTRRDTMVLALLGLPFLYAVVTGNFESAGSVLMRLSAAAPILMLALLGLTLFGAGDGRHGTASGRWAAICWIGVAITVVFLGNWFWPSILLSLGASGFGMIAGNGAWDHYENRIWGITAAPARDVAPRGGERARGARSRR